MPVTRAYDFTCHLRSRVFVRLLQGPGNELIASKAKWRTDHVWSTSCKLSPHFGLTVNVPQGNNSVHLFQIVEFMDVPHKSKKSSDSLKRHEFSVSWCIVEIWKPDPSGPSNLVLEQPMVQSQGEWVTELWRIYGRFANQSFPFSSPSACGVLGLVVSRFVNELTWVRMREGPAKRRHCVAEHCWRNYVFQILTRSATRATIVADTNIVLSTRRTTHSTMRPFVGEKIRK